MVSLGNLSRRCGRIFHNVASSPLTLQYFLRLKSNVSLIVLPQFNQSEETKFIEIKIKKYISFNLAGIRNLAQQYFGISIKNIKAVLFKF